MEKFFFLMFITFSGIFFTSCLDDSIKPDKEKIVEMTIFEETDYYGTGRLGNVITETLIFSDSDTNQEKILVDIIMEGFEDFYYNYERGYKYYLKVKKIWMQNPPQDVSSIKYVFIELISKEKVITEDSETNLQLFISSQTVKFSPEFPVEYEKGTENIKLYDALYAKVNNTDYWMVLKEIEGFDYEEGFEYLLQVKKVVLAEPYSVRYVLINVMSKEKDI